MRAPWWYRFRARLKMRGTWLFLAVVLLVSSSLLSAWNTYVIDREACESRTAGREDVRAAINAGVDEVAKFAEVDPPGRREVKARVESRVYAELPPPRC